MYPNNYSKNNISFPVVVFESLRAEHFSILVKGIQNLVKQTDFLPSHQFILKPIFWRFSNIIEQTDFLPSHFLPCDQMLFCNFEDEHSNSVFRG